MLTNPNFSYLKGARHENSLLTEPMLALRPIRGRTATRHNVVYRFSYVYSDTCTTRLDSDCTPVCEDQPNLPETEGQLKTFATPNWTNMYSIRKRNCIGYSSRTLPHQKWVHSTRHLQSTSCSSRGYPSCSWQRARGCIATGANPARETSKQHLQLTEVSVKW